ncbi:MAG: hypothetical protein ACK4NY_15480 [Spirosomataceae bacterium]
MEMQEMKPKSFWQKPEGVTGFLGLAGVILGGGYLLYKFLPFIITLLSNTLYAGLLFVALGALIYVILDPKFRNLIWYMYKSVMRWLTGLFVNIDPIGILKSYIDSLRDNLGKMESQIGNLKGQMRKLKDVMDNNKRIMEDNIIMANKAKEMGNQGMMVLKTRKAGRLQDSNLKLDELYKKMEILYRVLSKMKENSAILLEDVKDQVEVKTMEREAIRTSHSAMRSALNIISGDKDKRQMFDQAMEAIADDVSRKVGEMERFMDVSANFMDSIDLQNGIYEEKGLQMLEQWEKESTSFLLGDDKKLLVSGNESKPSTRSGNQYDKLFE